jgi:hypothetical protein
VTDDLPGWTRSRRPIGFLWRYREGISTVLMGLAALLTAWCAFESSKWSGIQAINFARAAGARTESTRNDLIDYQLGQIDVATFLAWVQAVRAEQSGNPAADAPTYRPDPSTTSGFLFLRFRPEFRAAVEAWVATRPLRNPDAPATPFAMPSYHRPYGDQAASWLEKTQERSDAALQANRNSNNYTLVTVFSSLVIFSAGLSTKLQRPANDLGLLLVACVSFAVCVVAILTLPVVVF